MYGISIEAASTLRDLRDKISRMLKIPEKRLILLHIDSRHGMEEFANDSDMIQEFFEDSETIEALETPSIPEIESTDGDGQPNEMCQQLITIVWLNRVGIDKSGPIFGPLFTALISREISFRKLQSTILSTMAPYLIDQENVKLSANLNLRIRVLNGLNGKDYLNSDVDHPLFVPTVEEALKKTEDPRIYRGPHHLKIMVEWDLDIRHSIIVSDEQIDSIFNNKPSFIDESVQLAKECSKLNSQTTLQDCLEIYFRDESVSFPSHYVVCFNSANHSLVNFGECLDVPRVCFTTAISKTAKRVDTSGHSHHSLETLSIHFQCATLQDQYDC